MAIVVLRGRLSNSSSQVRKLREAVAAEEGDRIPVRVIRQPTPRQAQRRLSPEEVEHLVAGYQGGATVPELVVRFQIHRTTVFAHLERHGVQGRRNRRKLTDQQVAEAAELYTAGWSTAKIGHKYNVSAETALQTLRKAGVPIRPRPGR
jgi:hypothetical protein